MIVEIKKIPLGKIRTNGGTQARVGLSEVTVRRYAEALEEGEEFPPVILFDDGTTLWLADGFHRVAAYRHLGRELIPVEIRHGTCRDALWFAVGANATHGLPRSHADRRRAVTLVLEDKEWREYTDHAIAMDMRVSNHLVAEIRAELYPPVTLENSKVTQGTLENSNVEPDAVVIEPAKRTGADGKKYTVKTKHLCERCTRLGGQVKGCQACPFVQGGKLRLGPKENAPPVQAGLYDWSCPKIRVGLLAKDVGDILLIYPEQAASPMSAGAFRLIEEMTKLFTAWEKQLSNKEN